MKKKIPTLKENTWKIFFFNFFDKLFNRFCKSHRKSLLKTNSFLFNKTVISFAKENVFKNFPQIFHQNRNFSKIKNTVVHFYPCLLNFRFPLACLYFQLYSKTLEIVRIGGQAWLLSWCFHRPLTIRHHSHHFPSNAAELCWVTELSLHFCIFSIFIIEISFFDHQ